jgi:hypothetical protein
MKLFLENHNSAQIKALSDIEARGKDLSLQIGHDRIRRHERLATSKPYQFLNIPRGRDLFCREGQLAAEALLQATTSL